jgi:Mg2+ and Co2+ transporter CorA
MDYGTSQTIANLIDVRDNEIKDGVTRRQTMKDVQEGIAALRRDVDLILKLLEDRADASKNRV